MLGNYCKIESNLVCCIFFSIKGQDVRVTIATITFYEHFAANKRLLSSFLVSLSA